MKQLIILTLLGTFIMADAMGGWNQENEEEKSDKIEAARICQIYKDKTNKYRKEMRDDAMAKATLKNYIRIEKRNCEKAESL